MHTEPPGLGEAVRAEHLLGLGLVHGEGRPEHARADIGDAGHLEQALHRAVLAEGTVQQREEHDGSVGIGGLHDR